MSIDARLAQLHGALRAARVDCLVMGGHAVRFYGIDRNTVDYDVHAALDDEGWRGLRELVQRLSPLAGTAVVEGPSLRESDFRRFVIGTLPDGREERLEFWRHNHLLAPFPDLWSRREEGLYGGETVTFLGLPDLMRSKETERDDDWRDVALLEEIADERALARCEDDRGRVLALSHLRSSRGYEIAARQGLLSGPIVATAFRATRQPITLAYLAPSVGAEPLPDAVLPSVAGLVDGALRQVTAGSPRHMALVEAVRRLWRSHAMAADRADKERALRNLRGENDPA